MRRDEDRSGVSSQRAAQEDGDLMSALTGLDAGQAQHAAERTRRVVTGSAGNLRERREVSGRSRNLAIAGAVLVLLLITPLIWSTVDSLTGDQHLTDTASELSLLGLLVGSTIFGAMTFRFVSALQIAATRWNTDFSRICFPQAGAFAKPIEPVSG